MDDLHMIVTRPAPCTRIEIPTLLLMAVCYGLWGLATAWADVLSLWLALPLAILMVALHSSLQHEVLHGHPTPSQVLNDALVFPAPGIFVPYERFRDLHLIHHYDPNLTDPYDDPESNFLDPEVWARLPRWRRWLLRANNTLLGRMAFGPGISLWALYSQDLRAVLAGDRTVARAYLLHLAGLVPVFAWLLAFGTMPLWAVLVAGYAGFSLLKIRTFLEHRAHEACSGRSVIVEDRGPLALLFLNNNLHAVHHGHPRVAWYDLPGTYRARKARFLEKNRHYVYRSYGEIFRQYLLTAKDPVPHPLYPKQPAEAVRRREMEEA